MLIGGFVVDEPSNVLLHGVGPSLATLGLDKALEDPQLTLFDSARAIVAQNTDWRLAIAGPRIPKYPVEEAPGEVLEQVMRSVGAFELQSFDAAGKVTASCKRSSVALHHAQSAQPIDPRTLGQAAQNRASRSQPGAGHPGRRNVFLVFLSAQSMTASVPLLKTLGLA